MRRLTRRGLGVLSLALGLGLVAGPVAKAAETIRIAENDWTGQLIDINLAKVIMEDHMGLDVELVFADYQGQWAGLAAGDLDVAMEIWPSFSHDAHREWIDEKEKVEVIGPLGVVGGTGWHVPTYVIEGDADRGIEPMAPDLKTYEDLNKYKKLFGRPETGDQGMFLAVVAAWEAGDEDRAKNLGLEYKVVYAGTEGAWTAEISSAYEKGEPLLFYLWSPHWIAGKYDVTEIEFPPYSDECYGVGTDKVATYACDFPEEATYNVARVGFKDEQPEAYQFLKNMQVTAPMQEEMLVMIDVDGMEVEAAVHQWVAENEATWRPWLP